jgi:hypothetical protein
MVWSIYIGSQKYMSENGIDDTAVQGNIVEETMHIEEGENKQQGEGEILQADDELKQRVTQGKRKKVKEEYQKLAILDYQQAHQINKHPHYQKHSMGNL